MFKYALIINAGSPILYIEKVERLHKEDVTEVKRTEIKYWRKELKIINALFKTNGTSEKLNDRDINNYSLKLRIGTESGGRALENENGTYQGLSTYLEKKIS